MQITTVENVVIPTGEYLAQVVDIESEQGNFGPQFRWKFDVLQPEEFIGKTLVGWTSTSPSLKGKFVKWASVCYGRAIGPGEELDTDDLVGSKVMLVVTVKESDDGAEFNKIDGVRVHKKAKPALPPQPKPAEDDGDFDPFGDQ